MKLYLMPKLKNVLSVLLLFLPSLSGAAILFSDDFKTGYTWGPLPITSQSTAVSQMSSKWQYIDWQTGHGAIDLWPADNTKNAYRIGYVNREDSDVIAHKFDPTYSNSTGRPTHIFVKYKEYRSSTFDCGPSKDVRFPAYRVSEYGGAGFPMLDIYAGFGNATAPGINACNGVGINVQGFDPNLPNWPSTYYDQSYRSGDPNGIIGASYSIPIGAEFTVQWELKLNTPGNFDGIARLWINGTQVLNAINVRWSNASYDQQWYFDGAQLGMTATNGSSAFEAISNIWRTDFQISDTYIPDDKQAQTILITTTAPANADKGTSFPVAATSSSGLAVAITVSGSCTLSGGSITMSNTATAACTVTFSQPGDSNYLAATNVSSISKFNQVITTGSVPGIKKYGDVFNVSPSASVTPVAVTTTGGCSNSGNVITMTSGTTACTINFDQVGNGVYASALRVTKTVTTAKAGQTITFPTQNPSARPFVLNNTFAVNPTATVSSNLPITYISVTTNTCSVTGTTVTMKARGTCKISAIQGGDGNYSAATSKIQQVTLQ